MLDLDCYTLEVRRRSIQPGGVARSVVASGALVCLIATVAASCLAQQSAASLPDSSSPIEMVRSAVANEVAASNDASLRHMFRSRKETRGRSQTRLYVETQDAMAGMTIAYDDHPLSPQQMQDERARLDRLQASPEELKRKHSQEKTDADHTLHIVKALPDAFLYEYAGRENSTPVLGKVGDELIRLKFRPNPSYSPPSRVEEVLKGMQGVVLIDPAARRLARIDGTLFKEVSFGWGFLGHLDKGGRFCVEQGALGDGTWDVTHMQLAFTGKILMVKRLNISSNEVFSDFRRVPNDTTFAKGVEMLKAEDARLAANQTLPGAATTGPKPH